MPPPRLHQSFVEHALTRLRADARIDAVLAAGSAITQTQDEFSDVDLIIVCRNSDYTAVMVDRRAIAESLGTLVAAFTGEHVGEPRLLICLYESPVLHVDLKFVTRDDLTERVETPVFLFDRLGSIDATLSAGAAEWPARSPEWFEDRFWIWVHYAAAKIARGELLEAHDMLTFVRAQVLGPMLARNNGHLQRGVRHLETLCPDGVADLAKTIPSYDRRDCWRALEHVVNCYCRYRAQHPPNPRRTAAEAAVTAYVTAERE